MGSHLIIAFCTLYILDGCRAHHHSGHVEGDHGLNPVEEIPKDIRYGISHLSLNLTKILVEADAGKNVIISPISIYNVLSLASLGSGGNTKTELLNLLGLIQHEFHFENLQEQIGNTIQKITKDNIKIATGVFLQQGITPKEDFVKGLSTYYNNKLNFLDFSKPQEATSYINNWVSQQTEGKISSLYSSPLPSTNQALLASSIYFSATWKNTFPPESTTKADFNTGSKTVQTDMMTNTVRNVPHIKSELLEYEGIVLPYNSSESMFVVILPTGSQTLSNLTKYLTLDSLAVAFNQSKNSFIRYSIPKFKLTYGTSLKDQLYKLGATTSFSNSANFENISPSLKFDDVYHKTLLELTEYGTTASGVTTVNIVPLTIPRRFTVDKPFLFYIYHVKSHAILFNGAIYDPTLAA